MGKKGQTEVEDKKPPKPKKIFTLSYEFWDDGEVTCSRVEKIAQERGAPKNLPYLEGEQLDFRRSIKTALQKNSLDILKELYRGIGIEESYVETLYNGGKSPSDETENEGEEAE